MTLLVKQKLLFRLEVGLECLANKLVNFCDTKAVLYVTVRFRIWIRLPLGYVNISREKKTVSNADASFWTSFFRECFERKQRHLHAM